jgi:hypothetical protein
MLEGHHNIRFHENVFRGSPVVTDGQTDIHGEAIGTFLQLLLANALIRNNKFDSRATGNMNTAVQPISKTSCAEIIISHTMHNGQYNIRMVSGQLYAPITLPPYKDSAVQNVMKIHQIVSEDDPCQWISTANFSLRIPFIQFTKKGT